MKKVLLLSLIVSFVIINLFFVSHSLYAASFNWGIAVNETTKQCTGWQEKDYFNYSYNLPLGWTYYSTQYYQESKYDFGTCRFRKSYGSVVDWRDCATSLGFGFIDYDDFGVPEEFQCEKPQAPGAIYALFVNQNKNTFTVANCDVRFIAKYKAETQVNDEIKMYKPLIMEVYETKLPAGSCYDDGRSPKQCCTDLGYSFIDGIWNEDLTSRPRQYIIQEKISGLVEGISDGFILYLLPQYIFALIIIALIPSFRRYTKKIILTILILSFLIFVIYLVSNLFLPLGSSYAGVLSMQLIIEPIALYFIMKRKFSFIKILFLILAKTVLGLAAFMIFGWWAFRNFGF